MYVWLLCVTWAQTQVLIQARHVFLCWGLNSCMCFTYIITSMYFLLSYLLFVCMYHFSKNQSTLFCYFDERTSTLVTLFPFPQIFISEDEMVILFGFHSPVFCVCACACLAASVFSPFADPSHLFHSHILFSGPLPVLICPSFLSLSFSFFYSFYFHVFYYTWDWIFFLIKVSWAGLELALK